MGNTVQLQMSFSSSLDYFGEVKVLIVVKIWLNNQPYQTPHRWLKNCDAAQTAIIWMDKNCGLTFKNTL